MRVGLLGAGRIGSFHAATLQAHPDVDEVVVADIDRAVAERVASTVGATRADSVDAALASGLDSVVIASATSAHAELIHAAADARLPIFCEKPIALDLEETRSVLDHVAAAGVEVQIGFQRRFDAGFVDARRRIEAGELGRLYSLRLIAADAELPPPGYIPTSGGMFRDMHIHDFDLARWLTGVEVEEIYATGSGLDFKEFEDYDDIAGSASILTMSDGTIVTVTGARHNPNGYDVRAEISGANHAIAVGLVERAPVRFTEPAPAWAMGKPYAGFLDRFEDAYRAELGSFIDLVKGRGANRCTADDALEALRIAVAADLSRKEHRPVRLDEIP